jgi:hypothetical protein
MMVVVVVVMIGNGAVHLINNFISHGTDVWYKNLEA